MAHADEEKTAVCLIIPSLQAGGMERVMSELARYFQEIDNVSVHLVLYGINREIFYSIPSTVSVHLPSFTFNNRIRVLSSLRTMMFIRAKVKELKPTTILSFGEYWNSFVLLSLLGVKYPIFISDRNQPDKSLGRLHDFLRKYLYPLSTGVIAQTAIAKKIYHELYQHENIEVIGNPVRKILERDYPRENIVLMVGRFIKSKNQDKLIQLFAEINKPDWKLVLVGYDHLKQENEVLLRDLIKKLNLTDRVILAGKESNVDEYYSKSKIFAFTSTSEGFPNVIGEAMSAGLAVIAFDCMAGPADLIVNEKNGILITPGNYAEFKNKLEILMDNEALRIRLGEEAHRGIDNFSINHIGSKYLNFITTFQN